MGIYGVEGSKPGAAAAEKAVWLADKSIPLNQDGYGRNNLVNACSLPRSITAIG